MLTALVGRDDAVFADKLNHACLNDGAQLCRADFVRYAHCDVEALAARLALSNARRKLICTDAVFSMDGDIAPLPKLLALAEATMHGSWSTTRTGSASSVLGSTAVEARWRTSGCAPIASCTWAR